MHEGTFVTDLAIVLGVAAVTSLLARVLRQPTILGYLVAGLIVGPYIPIPLFADAHRVEALAEFGVVLVMFAIGLEFRIAKLLRVLPTSGLTGVVQISFLLWCGFSLGQLLGWGTVESVFLGACVAISSTMVVSGVFAQKPVGDDVRQFVLGVLVIQDVVAIVLIAAMTALAAGGGMAPGELATLVGQLAAVLLAMLGLGMLIVPRLIRAVERLESPEILAVFSIGVCFATALLAEKFGYSVALGAFIAGILVAESGRGTEVEHLIQPVRDVFAAVFFVSIGMTVNPAQAWEHLPTALIVFAVVVLAQLLSVSGAGVLSGNGLRRSILAGCALGQIGEFSFILASIGIGAGVVRGSLQPILVTVAVLTAFTTPLMLGLGDRLARRVDRLLPLRVQHLLSLYDEWLERFHARPAAARQGRPVRKALGALAFDALALTGLVVAAVSWLPQLSGWLSRSLAMAAARAEWLIQVVVVLLFIPLLFALVRNTLLLARLVGESILPSEPTGAAVTAERTMRVMVYLGVVVGVGAPMVALLRPMVGASYGIVLLSGAVVGVVFFLWRSAGRMEQEFQSGAGQIAQLLARQSEQEPEETPLSDPTLLPGLDTVTRFRIPPDAHAVGRCLAELELRARTGATVLAIRRGDSEAILPTAREPFQAGDLVAIVGSADAVRKAEGLLVAGPPSSGYAEYPIAVN